MYVSRHHPVSSKTPINHPGVSSKWSKKQDQKLKKAVLKRGTQWALITKQYKFERSTNSLVKRWHGKLKYQVQNNVQVSSEPSEIEDEQRSQSQKLKKTRKQQKKDQKIRKIQKMQRPKSRRGGYRPKRRNQQQQRHQNRDRSRNRKESNAEKEARQNERRNIKAIEEESNSQQKKKQNEQKEDDEEENSIDNSESNFVFQHKWKQSEDKLLKQMVLNDHILNWQELAGKLNVQNIREVRKRWKHNVYPEIVLLRKIGGCLKYSEEEDAILSRGVKLGMSIGELRKFLPNRTQYSLEARRRRTLKMDQEEVPELRYWTKKLLAYKFVQKRHEHLQKPTQDDEFLYRSDSE